MSSVESASPVGWLPARVRAARKGLGLTQQQAADRAGVGLRTWQMFENGHTVSPQDGNLRAMLAAVGVEPGPEVRDLGGAQEWPADVQVVRDMLAAFLVTMDVEARLAFVHELTRWIVTGHHD